MPCKQAETIAFLASPDGFGSGEAGCETVTTPLSTVLLLGEKAIKLKKAVRFPQLDFSSPDRRLEACLAEIRLNRRTAPHLYRAVHQITREHDGRLALNGAGALVDAVVEMQRFDHTAIFDTLARRGELSIEDTTKLGRRIADLHAAAEIVPCDGASRVAAVIAGIERNLAAAVAFSPAEVATVMQACRSALARHGDLLDRRALVDKVRHGHGDLQLRNVCLVEGEPTLFDCLEFDAELATGDVLYDLAFILIDLWHRNLPRHANALFNRYLDVTGDDGGVALLPLFMALRALGRAHVTASETARTELASAWALAEARACLKLARDVLAVQPPVIVAVGGYSGSGKSTVIARIAPEVGTAPGARVLSSDSIRKQLFEAAPETRLGPEAYAAAVSDRVDATLLHQAELVISGGHAVIADAVFNRSPAREQLAAIALRYRVRYHGLWLDAPADMLMRRVAERRGSTSDATPAVVMEQIASGDAPTDWLRLCASCDADTVLDAVRLAIGTKTRARSFAKACARMQIPSSLPTLSCSRVRPSVEAPGRST